MFVLVVDAGEGLTVEQAAVPTVVDPGVAVHAHDVGSLVTGLGEPSVTEQISLQIIQFGAILILQNVWNQAIILSILLTQITEDTNIKSS